MKYLLSLPPNLTAHFHELEQKAPEEWFCTADPVGSKLGSGGGTAHMWQQAWQARPSGQSLETWCQTTRHILLHAGGQSRRLPAYAPAGKILTPLPVFRWARGQRLDQQLLDLQLPLLEELLEAAPAGYRSLIASGDVLIRTSAALPDLPEADVLCLGMWVEPEVVQHFGVFFTERNRPQELAFALQKPDPTTVRRYAQDYYFMIDIGIWLLSERAMALLMEKCGWQPERQQFADGMPYYYDLYSDLGRALGHSPSQPDPALANLRCAVVPLDQGEFYHFGKTEELISSCHALQNRVADQRHVLHRYVKPHPEIFVQNARTDITFTPNHQRIWIENSHLSAGWYLSREHVLTGIIQNDWSISLDPGQCLDMVPLDQEHYCLRPYGFRDQFRGRLDDPQSHWLGQPALAWLQQRGISPAEADLMPESDLQQAALFPVIRQSEITGAFVQWLLATQPGQRDDFRALWLQRRLSAQEISEQADLAQLYRQRKSWQQACLPLLARNHQQSVFYQLDLGHLAAAYAAAPFDLPAPPTDLDPLRSMHDQMFRSQVLRLRGDKQAGAWEQAAFTTLREAITATARANPVQPQRDVLSDQIVWGRAPVRLDLAGGWTDTPPYCLLHGGRVLNLAVELNGQPPLQVYAKPLDRPEIVIRSIDLSYEERITEYEQLGNYQQLGAAFAIPKAALALAGLEPQFACEAAPTLVEQLQAAGGGIELTLLAAVPKGSGLGTSSILAANVLGVLSEFYQLGWDQMAIGHRTLILEQLLTSGGGWQDQYGGCLPGIKYLETPPGLDQRPEVRWLPDQFFRQAEQRQCIRLYYTGITRVAHNILGEIVRGMFLNSADHLPTLHRLYKHAADSFEQLQRGRYEDLARLVERSWHLNQALDSGTNPPSIQSIVAQVDDLLLGKKLLGAGGGGFLLFLAKDPEAAQRLEQRLTQSPPNRQARFVDITLSESGLEVTRS